MRKIKKHKKNKIVRDLITGKILKNGEAISTKNINIYLEKQAIKTEEEIKNEFDK